VRMSGPGCIELAGRAFKPERGDFAEKPSRRMVLGRFYAEDGRALDHCMAAAFRAPASYTGEDCVELFLHGSPAVAAAVLKRLYALGARPAQAGEFTRRAFLNGKMDLAQAAAIPDLVDAIGQEAAINAAGQVMGRLSSLLSRHESALTDILAAFAARVDYPEEDVDDAENSEIAEALNAVASALEQMAKDYERGRVYREGVSAALIGKTNAGKSSLLNALLGCERAIVSSEEGTTRDTVEQWTTLAGVPVRLIDTAGLRQGGGEIEKLGQQRSRAAAESAGLVIAVVDASRAPDDETLQALKELEGRKGIIALNKCDLGVCEEAKALSRLAGAVEVSAVTGEGLSKLTDLVGQMFGAGSLKLDGSIITRESQARAVSEAAGRLREAAGELMVGITPDAALSLAEQALDELMRLSGKKASDEIISRVFENFCVGK